MPNITTATRAADWYIDRTRSFLQENGFCGFTVVAAVVDDKTLTEPECLCIEGPADMDALGATLRDLAREHSAVFFVMDGRIAVDRVYEEPQTSLNPPIFE